MPSVGQARRCLVVCQPAASGMLLSAVWPLAAAAHSRSSHSTAQLPSQYHTHRLHPLHLAHQPSSTQRTQPVITSPRYRPQRPGQHHHHRHPRQRPRRLHPAAQAAVMDHQCCPGHGAWCSHAQRLQDLPRHLHRHLQVGLPASTTWWHHRHSCTGLGAVPLHIQLQASLLE